MVVMGVVVPCCVMVVALHVVLWASHCMWCCGRRTACGVAGVTLCVVL